MMDGGHPVELSRIMGGFMKCDASLIMLAIRGAVVMWLTFQEIILIRGVEI